MQLVVQLVLAVIVFGVTLSGGSLVWPKITHNPRPQLLQQVHDWAITTPMGMQAANVLGVSDETSVEPINIGQIAGSISNSIKTAAQNRVTTIIMKQVTSQINTRYQNLSDDQKQELQQIICTPQDVVK